VQDDLTLRLERCYTGVIHDVMRAQGLRDFTLPPELRPIMPERALAGPAFTIEGRVDQSLSAHETLLAWTGLLSKAPHGHIWVSQPNDRNVAHMGELSAETLKNKGVLGLRDRWLHPRYQLPVGNRLPDLVSRFHPT
jgi:regulator of RNase E activity RraA